MSESMITVSRPKTKGLVDALMPFVKQALAFKITSSELYETASARISALRQGAARVKLLFEPARTAIDDAKKEILKARDDLAQPLIDAAEAYSDGCDVWKRHVELEAERERKKIEASVKREVATLVKTGLVEKSDAKQMTETKVDRLVESRVSAETPSVARERTNWSAEVEDERAAVAHALSRPELLKYVMMNMIELNALAREKKQADLGFPGVKGVASVTRY